MKSAFRNAAIRSLQPAIHNLKSIRAPHPPVRNKSALRSPQSALHVCALVCSLAQTTPALPRLALDAFPPQARDALSRTYAAAIARPDDVGAVGALARTLHAW